MGLSTAKPATRAFGKVTKRVHSIKDVHSHAYYTHVPTDLFACTRVRVCVCV